MEANAEKYFLHICLYMYLFFLESCVMGEVRGGVKLCVGGGGGGQLLYISVGLL